METTTKSNDLYKYLLGGALFEIAYFALSCLIGVGLKDIGLFMVVILLFTIITSVAMVTCRKRATSDNVALKLGCGWFVAQAFCVIVFEVAEKFIDVFQQDKVIADKDAMGLFFMIAYQEILYIVAAVIIFVFLVKDIKKAETAFQKVLHILMMVLLLAFVSLPLTVLVMEL